MRQGKMSILIFLFLTFVGTSLGQNSLLMKKIDGKDDAKSAKGKIWSGDYQGALHDINLAISQIPDPDFYVIRGSIYTLLLEDDLKRSHEDKWFEYLKKAVSDFDQALRKSPNMYNAFFQRGYLGFIIQEERDQTVVTQLPSFPNADEDFETASLIEPENPSPYFYLGKYYNLQNNPPDKTIDYFIKAIKYSRDSSMKANSYYQLAWFYFKRQSHIDVIKNVDESIKLYPEFFSARRLRGITNYQDNELDRALIDFNWIIKKYPDYKGVADIYRFRAKSLFKKSGNFKSACPDMKKASELGDEEATRFMNEVCK